MKYTLYNTFDYFCQTILGLKFINRMPSSEYSELIHLVFHAMRYI